MDRLRKKIPLNNAKELFGSDSSLDALESTKNSETNYFESTENSESESSSDDSESSENFQSELSQNFETIENCNKSELGECSKNLPPIDFSIKNSSKSEMDPLSDESDSNEPANKKFKRK